MKLTKEDIQDLMLACSVLADKTSAKRWDELYDKLSELLKDGDDDGN